MSQPAATDSSKRSITAYQAFALVHSTMMGVGVLSLPREVSREAGSDAIWVVLLGALPVWLFLFFMSRLIRRFPGETIVEFAPRILGPERRKWIGKWISVPFLLPLAVFWILALSQISRIFGEAVVSAVLLRTPIEAVLLMLILASAIAAGSKIGVIAKFNELLFPFTLVPLIFILVSIFERGDLTNVLPLFQADWQHVLRGILVSAFAFAGYKVVLVFGGYYQQPEQSFKAHSWSVLTVTLIYWGLVVNAVSVFGPHELVNMLWPVLESMKVIQLQNFILERMEAGIIAIWVTAVYTSMVNMYAAFTEMTMRFFRLDERMRKWVVIAVIPIIYTLSLYPDNIQETTMISGRVGIVALILAATLPAMLLIIAVFRRKKGGSEHETVHSA
jgi:spore germination protein